MQDEVFKPYECHAALLALEGLFLRLSLRLILWNLRRGECLDAIVVLVELRLFVGFDVGSQVSLLCKCLAATFLRTLERLLARLK